MVCFEGDVDDEAGDGFVHCLVFFDRVEGASVYVVAEVIDFVWSQYFVFLQIDLELWW